MKLIKILSICLVLASSAFMQVNAQEKESSIKNPGIPKVRLGVQNMFYWRGAPLSVFSTEEQTPTPLITGEFSYTKGAFTAGFWTGQSFSSSGYKNASYYFSYAHKNFQVGLWDIYTYSGVSPDRSKDFFNYNNSETQHFIDLNFSYQFNKIPLSLYLATIVYGRDGNYVDGSYENRYSTYLKANYNVSVGDGYSFDFYVSGAGALNNIDGINFYETSDAEHPYGVSEVGITAHKALKISSSYSIPISVGAVASPMNKRMDGIIAVQLL